jgi:archaetidylinositol phosphate synthase
MKIEKKNKIEKLFYPIAPNVNPHLVTLLSIVAMVIGGYLVYLGYLAYAAVFVLISGFLDVMDGAVAKKYCRASKLGAFADRSADRINDVIILGAIAVSGYVNVFLGILVIVVIVLASYMSAVIEGLTKSKVGEALSMRPVRLTIVVVALLVPHPQALYWAMFALLFTGFYSVFARLLAAYSILK